MDSSDESKLREEKRIREELANAFPLAIRQEALIAISALSENRFSSRWQTCSLRLGYELLALPQRIYYAPPALQTLRLSTFQMEILDCLPAAINTNRPTSKYFFLSIPRPPQTKEVYPWLVEQTCAEALGIGSKDT
jgi:hypothetical protein